jgi:putative ABC transport system permease protein
VAGLPGVLAVAAVNHVPLNGALASADYKVAGRPPLRDDQLPTAQYRMVTPAYFRAMGIPLVAGRAFDEEDREGGAPVAIVSQALARQSFPEENPVGQHLLVQDTTAGFRSLEVVGVVGDVKHLSLESGAEPHLYVSYHQTPADLLVWLTLNQFLVVKTVGPPLALGDPVRREVAAIDANVATADARPSGYYVENAMASRRFGLVLVSLFAALGLAMAAIGIYGVVAYSVAQRRRETGVRLALGAGTSDILGLVLKEGLHRTLIGVGAGLGAAAASTRALGSLLYGVSATEPLAYAVAAALLMSVTLLACLLPAWRAARSSPLEALRHE